MGGGGGGGAGPGNWWNPILQVFFRTGHFSISFQNILSILSQALLSLSNKNLHGGCFQNSSWNIQTCSFLVKQMSPKLKPGRPSRKDGMWAEMGISAPESSEAWNTENISSIKTSVNYPSLTLKKPKIQSKCVGALILHFLCFYFCLEGRRSERGGGT